MMLLGGDFGDYFSFYTTITATEFTYGDLVEVTNKLFRHTKRLTSTSRMTEFMALIARS